MEAAQCGRRVAPSRARGNRLTTGLWTPRRRQAFSSSHRLFSRELGEDASRKTYGKCTNVHGHNYVLFVTVRGEVGAADGMVMNLVDLKTIIQEEVMDQLDHKSIDAHPWFNEGERPSTVENVAVFCFERIHARLPAGASVSKVKVYETENNVAVYRGETTA